MVCFLHINKQVPQVYLQVLEYLFLYSLFWGSRGGEVPAKDAAPAEILILKKIKNLKKRFSKPTVPCRVFSLSVSFLQQLRVSILQQPASISLASVTSLNNLRC